MPQFMDPLSAITSIVRIVGIEIQIVLDAIKTATERVEQIVLENQATQ